jgi:hypothetical protein
MIPLGLSVLLLVVLVILHLRGASQDSRQAVRALLFCSVGAALVSLV